MRKAQIYINKTLKKQKNYAESWGIVSHLLGVTNTNTIVFNSWKVAGWNSSEVTAKK